MQINETKWIRISARMPQPLVARLTQLYPSRNLSETLRELMEKEVLRQKVLKAHMKLYGRFRPEHFKEIRKRADLELILLGD